jgi:hypothetical protein
LGKFLRGWWPGAKKNSGFGNYFQHVKKFLNFGVLANFKVAPAKFFNFGFYCKPSLFFFDMSSEKFEKCC